MQNVNRNLEFLKTRSGSRTIGGKAQGGPGVWRSKFQTYQTLAKQNEGAPQTQCLPRVRKADPNLVTVTM